MNTALVLIDIQNDYFPGGKMELSGSIEAGLRAGEILAFFRDNRMPVVHIQHLSARPGATFFLPGTRARRSRNASSRLPTKKSSKRIIPTASEKRGCGNFSNKRRINHLVIAGMMTHMCVDATVRSAFDLGFTCTLIHDACATRNLSFENQTVPAEHVHAAFLSALNGLYAKVVSGSEFVANFKK